MIMDNYALNYEISCEDRNGYLLVKVSDTSISLAEAVDYTNKVMRRFREGGYKDVIVVRDVPLDLTERQLRIFGDVIANMLPADGRMAIVDQAGTFDETKVVAKTAQLRERNVSVFRDVASAEDWIETSG